MTSIPHTVFLIPYRNREKEARYFKDYFEHYVKKQKNMESGATYYFCHQADKRPFNRGGTKNIGFLAIKELYPNDWQNITFVFHDIDCYPNKNVSLPYTTVHGKIAHYYGFKQTLGGIVVIKGSDFEKIGGFPNFWGWGYEDNALYNRVIEHKLDVDRTIFFDVNDLDHFHRLDKQDEKKIVNPKDSMLYSARKYDSVHDIYNIKKSVNHSENVIHIFHFFSRWNAPNNNELRIFDLNSREPNLIKYLNSRGIYRSGRNWGLSISK